LKTLRQADQSKKCPIDAECQTDKRIGLDVCDEDDILAGDVSTIFLHS
uniref:Ubiquitin-like domain-containing protein n=1 Tax=Rodentolepis nana TaxID=102285 RepID=A0A0R3THE6_RODNA